MTNTNYFLLTATLAAYLFLSTACNHSSLEDRAEKDAKDFTERYCPTPVQQMQRTDSITFDRSTHTFKYYYTLTNAADNADNVNKVKHKLKPALLKDLKDNTNNKLYKKEAYNFHYIFRSESSKKVLYELVLTAKDYK